MKRRCSQLEGGHLAHGGPRRFSTAAVGAWWSVSRQHLPGAPVGRGRPRAISGNLGQSRAISRTAADRAAPRSCRARAPPARPPCAAWRMWRAGRGGARSRAPDWAHMRGRDQSVSQWYTHPSHGRRGTHTRGTHGALHTRRWGCVLRERHHRQSCNRQRGSSGRDQVLSHYAGRRVAARLEHT